MILYKKIKSTLLSPFNQLLNAHHIQTTTNKRRLGYLLHP